VGGASEKVNTPIFIDPRKPDETWSSHLGAERRMHEVEGLQILLEPETEEQKNLQENLQGNLQGNDSGSQPQVRTGCPGFPLC